MSKFVSMANHLFDKDNVLFFNPEIILLTRYPNNISACSH